MNSEARMIIEIWDTVRENIPSPKRAEVAHGIMVAVSEYGIEPHDISEICDEDKYLARAFADVYDIDEDERDPEEDE